MKNIIVSSVRHRTWRDQFLSIIFVDLSVVILYYAVNFKCIVFENAYRSPIGTRWRAASTRLKSMQLPYSNASSTTNGQLSTTARRRRAATAPPHAGWRSTTKSGSRTATKDSFGRWRSCRSRPSGVCSVWTVASTTAPRRVDDVVRNSNSYTVR